MRQETRGRAFDHFTAQKTVVLTTYRRDGTPVPTPVHIVVDGDHAHFRTPSTAGKVKRLRRNADVEIAPSTFRGRLVGPAMLARARLLSEEESRPVRRALARKYPIMQGFVVPLVHRFVYRCRTLHYELTPR